MLRVETEQHGDRYRLTLHGSLTGEWVAVLERYWKTLVRSVPSARITVELSDVSFIDRAGEGLLERIWRRGAKFVASGCVNRHVVDTIRSRNASARLSTARER
jgi:ABC-type transporter Mla MlaB component